MAAPLIIERKKFSGDWPISVGGVWWAAAPHSRGVGGAGGLPNQFHFQIRVQYTGSATRKDGTIRRPLLARGTKAARFDTVPLWTIMGHACSYQAAICCYLLSGPKSVVDSPRQMPNSRFVYHQNPCDFKLVFKAHKTRKTASQASRKESIPTPTFMKKHFCGKNICAIPSLRKPPFLESQAMRFRLRSRKKKPGNKPEQNEISSFLKSKS